MIVQKHWAIQATTKVPHFERLFPLPQISLIFFLLDNDQSQIGFGLGRYNWDYSYHSNLNNESVFKIHFYKVFDPHLDYLELVFTTAKDIYFVT